ncbi:MAG TPA: VOC family protein [Bauldia sp.]|nr:VOC family protein [Bauldia sp.]
MSDESGRFVWYELMTTDPRAAEAFYAAVVGWTAKDSGMTATTGAPYTILWSGDAMVAGLMTMPEEPRKMGVPPNWGGYISVDDVDAAAEKAKRLGGAIYMPPTDIPNVGRFAVVADPQGAAFNLFKSLPPQTPPVVPAPGSPGTIGWHELWTTDWEKGFAFYGDMFGWKKDQAIDIGPMGTYQLFAPSSGGPAIGGMWNKPKDVPVAFWLYYFNVEAIDAAADRVKANGGKIVNGPMEVPGGSFIVQCQDPQGAMFALNAMKR